jgi:hypothetical protein
MKFVPGPREDRRRNVFYRLHAPVAQRIEHRASDGRRFASSIAGHANHNAVQANAARTALTDARARADKFRVSCAIAQANEAQNGETGANSAIEAGSGTRSPKATLVYTTSAGQESWHHLRQLLCLSGSRRR